MEFRQTQTVGLKQSLEQRISLRVQQAIKLLQYSHVEMVEHVQEALLENPTLEAVPDSEGDAISDRERELRVEAGRDQADHNEQLNGNAESTVDWDKYIENMGSGSSSALSSSSAGSQYDDLPPIETNLTYGESLGDHLLWQLQLHKCNEDEELAAAAIIGNLDHRGYLACSLDDIIDETGFDAQMVEDALELVQGLDPIGCGARTLSECLVVQARVHYAEDDLFVTILTEHLGNLERRNYAAIARDLELELEDVIEYHKMIVELEPHPGRGYAGSDARYITPDVYVIKQDGEWRVALNEDGMPDLRVNRSYEGMLSSVTKDDKQYLVDKLKGAEFLIKSIHRRRRTIVRVMEEIVRQQRAFFDHGPEALRPMILQDVADKVLSEETAPRSADDEPREPRTIHMSTVSRVTSNKYVHTPHGILELKYFFTAGVRQQSGGDMSGEAIKTRIKGLVASENPKKPMSDQAIANALAEDGVRVARRTVAKYREALGILPSSRRKNLF